MRKGVTEKKNGAMIQRIKYSCYLDGGSRCFHGWKREKKKEMVEEKVKGSFSPSQRRQRRAA